MQINKTINVMMLIASTVHAQSGTRETFSDISAGKIEAGFVWKLKVALQSLGTGSTAITLQK